MQNVFKKSIVVILLGLLLFGAGAVSAQDDGGAGPDSPSVVVIADEGGDESQSFNFVLLIGLGMFAVVIIQSVFGQRGLEMALQAGGLWVGKTASPDDDRWLIEVAIRNGYAPTRLPDGTITFEKKEPRPDDANGGA